MSEPWAILIDQLSKPTLLEDVIKITKEAFTCKIYVQLLQGRHRKGSKLFSICSDVCVNFLNLCTYNYVR